MLLIRKKYGAAGYGVTLMLFERIMSTPNLSALLYFDAADLNDIGVEERNGEIWLRDFIEYCVSIRAFEIVNAEDVYYEIKSTWLEDMNSGRIKDRITQRVKSRIRKQEDLTLISKGRARPMSDLREKQLKARKINTMCKSVQFSEAQIREMQNLFISYDVRKMIEVFRDHYIVAPENVDIYLETMNRKSAVDLFMAWMKTHVITKSENDDLINRRKQIVSEEDIIKGLSKIFGKDRNEEGENHVR